MISIYIAEYLISALWYCKRGATTPYIPYKMSARFLFFVFLFPLSESNIPQTDRRKTNTKWHWYEYLQGVNAFKMNTNQIKRYITAKIYEKTLDIWRSQFELTGKVMQLARFQMKWIDGEQKSATTIAYTFFCTRRTHRSNLLVKNVS